MNITHEDLDNIRIVNIHEKFLGRVVSSFNHAFRPLFQDALASPDVKYLIFNLEYVDMIDSVGIGLICAKYVQLKKSHKFLALCSPTDSLREVLVTSGLEELLPIYDNLESALEGLKASELQK